MGEEKRIFDIRGQLVEYDQEENTMKIKLFDDVDVEEAAKLSHNGKYYMYVDFHDKRNITDEQRKYFWALMGDYADYAGHLKEATGNHFQYQFMLEKGLPSFPSTSRNGMKLVTARQLLQFVLEYFIDKGIPFHEQEFYLAEDETRLFYALTMNRICWICGKEHSHLHHAVNLVQRGRDRNKHNHLKSKFMCLCAEHHQEAHSMGLQEFMDRYYIKPIKLDKASLKELNIRGRYDEGELETDKEV